MHPPLPTVKAVVLISSVSTLVMILIAGRLDILRNTKPKVMYAAKYCVISPIHSLLFILVISKEENPAVPPPPPIYLLKGCMRGVYKNGYDFYHFSLKLSVLACSFKMDMEFFSILASKKGTL